MKKQKGCRVLLLLMLVACCCLFTSEVAVAGTEEYLVEEDGELVIEPYLTTYNPASFKVYIDDSEVFSWVRSDDIADEFCVVNGVVDRNSMYLNKPGDYSPTQGLSYTVSVDAGQVVRAVKTGNYLSESYLRLNGPVTRRASLDSVLGETGTKAESSSGSSGKIEPGRGRGFLWKPVSESTGKCVVLLPSSYRQEDLTGKLLVNGKNEIDQWRPGYANGNRVHIYLKKTGSAYGSDIKVDVGLKKGGMARWVIPRGARRHEQ